MSVIDEVAAERRRHVAVEGWTPEHDDQHTKGELALAAAAYAIGPLAAIGVWNGFGGDSAAGQWRRLCDVLWPWSSNWWKPKSRRRNLIRAASLIIAEIERLDRAAGGNG